MASTAEYWSAAPIKFWCVPVGIRDPQQNLT